jgi:hypothetical protein
MSVSTVQVAAASVKYVQPRPASESCQRTLSSVSNIKDDPFSIALSPGGRNHAEGPRFYRLAECPKQAILGRMS